MIYDISRNQLGSVLSVICVVAMSIVVMPMVSSLISDQETINSFGIVASLPAIYGRTYGGPYPDGRTILGGWRMSATNTNNHGRTPEYWAHAARVLGGDYNLNLYIFGVTTMDATGLNGYCNVGYTIPPTESHPANFNDPWCHTHPWIGSFKYGGDMNEAFLSKFDEEGVNVLLQVESGKASVDQLIELLLEKYGHHSSVKGFAIDLEWKWRPWIPSEYAKIFPEGEVAYTNWYNTMNDGILNGKGVVEWEDKACSAETAQRWLNLVKSYDSTYKLLLKRHFNAAIPVVDDPDIIVCSDNQGASLDRLVREANSFAEKYSDSQQMFAHQIGYEWDKAWTFSPPIGTGIYDVVNTHDLETEFLNGIEALEYILWVDESAALEMYDALQEIQPS